MIRHEQTREGPRCPECHCPTRAQLSPTGAQTGFLSSGRREYITGYTSPLSSQQYRGGVTTANADTNSTSLPYGSAASSYGSVAATSGYQVSPPYSRTSERSQRTSQVTRTQPRNYPLRTYNGSRSQMVYVLISSTKYPLQLTGSLPTTQHISPPLRLARTSYSTPAPAASEQHATRAPQVTSGATVLLSKVWLSPPLISYASPTSASVIEEC